MPSDGTVQGSNLDEEHTVQDRAIVRTESVEPKEVVGSTPRKHEGS